MSLSDFIGPITVGAPQGNTVGAPQSISNGSVVLAGGPNVTLSQAGRTITISVAAGAGGVALSAGASSQSTGTISFADSNGLTFGLNNGTLTGSYTVPTVPPETPFGVSAGTQSVSTGTLVFSNSNGISFGMSGSSRVTASYTVPTVPAQFTGGFSTGGNTVGNTGLVTGRLVLAGGPNITLSGSTNAGSITVSISGGAGAAGNTGFISAGANTASLGTVVFSNSNSVSFGVNGQTVTASISTLPETPFGVSAGTQSVSTGTLVFSNSNNVTFGMSGSSRVTASASFPAETPFGISAGTQSVSTGTLVFSNANNVTFGMSGSTRVTASASFPAETPFGISAGTQSVSTGTMNFADSNGISFGMSGSSRITASYTVPPSVTVSEWTPNMGHLQLPTAATLVNAVPVFIPASAPFWVSASKAEFMVSIGLSTSSNSSHAGAISAHYGLYTRNGSTLSLATSGSMSVQWTNTGSNSVNSVGGVRKLTGTLNLFVTPGLYYLGALARTSTTNANWFTVSFFRAIIGGPATVGMGLVGGATNFTEQFPLGAGVYSATTAALPASVALSQIRASTVINFPHMQFVNLST